MLVRVPLTPLVLRRRSFVQAPRLPPCGLDLDCKGSLTLPLIRTLSVRSDITVLFFHSKTCATAPLFLRTYRDTTDGKEVEATKTTGKGKKGAVLKRRGAEEKNEKAVFVLSPYPSCSLSSCSVDVLIDQWIDCLSPVATSAGTRVVPSLEESLPLRVTQRFIVVCQNSFRTLSYVFVLSTQ